MSTVLDYVYYDLTSPSCLRWKQDKLDKLGRRTAIKKGAEAGYKTYQKQGTPSSWKVQFEGKFYSIHRLIFAMFYPDFNLEDKTQVIDHLDRNPFNNLITNLTLKTHKGNCQNKGKLKRNTSGVTGVCYDNHSKSWRASWYTPEGRQTSRSFSCLKYGDDKAFELAVKIRKTSIEELNLCYNQDYTTTHGE